MKSMESKAVMGAPARRESDIRRVHEVVWVKLYGSRWLPAHILKKETLKVAECEQSRLECPSILCVRFFSEAKTVQMVHPCCVKRFSEHDEVDINKDWAATRKPKGFGKSVKQASSTVDRKFPHGPAIRYQETCCHVDHKSKYVTGQVVWARLEGYSWWPGFVADRQNFPGWKEDKNHPLCPREHPIGFFNDHGQHGVVHECNMKPFENKIADGILLKTSEAKKIMKAIQDAEEHLKRNENASATLGEQVAEGSQAELVNGSQHLTANHDGVFNEYVEDMLPTGLENTLEETEMQHRSFESIFETLGDASIIPGLEDMEKFITVDGEDIEQDSEGIPNANIMTPDESEMLGGDGKESGTKPGHSEYQVLIIADGAGKDNTEHCEDVVRPYIADGSYHKGEEPKVFRKRSRPTDSSGDAVADESPNKKKVQNSMRWGGYSLIQPRPPNHSFSGVN